MPNFLVISKLHMRSTSSQTFRANDISEHYTRSNFRVMFGTYFKRSEFCVSTRSNKEQCIYTVTKVELIADINKKIIKKISKKISKRYKKKLTELIQCRITR